MRGELAPAHRRAVPQRRESTRRWRSVLLSTPVGVPSTRSGPSEAAVAASDTARTSTVAAYAQTVPASRSPLGACVLRCASLQQSVLHRTRSPQKSLPTIAGLSSPQVRMLVGAAGPKFRAGAPRSADQRARGQTERGQVMAEYCVNRQQQTNGDHEVHERGCQFWPSPANALSLGSFSICAGAVQAARQYYHQVNGCRTCSRPCHTQ